MLTLDRPECLNALTEVTFLNLIGELEQIGADGAVRAVVLTGANGAFSAGADLDVLERLPDLGEAETELLLSHLMRASALIHALPQPVIAAITGPAVGGGLSFALACDIRIASPDATFLAPFTRMGLVPDCGATWLLPRVVGHAHALEVLLGASPLDAHDAQRIGLVSRVCPDPLHAALDLAAAFARRPHDAVRATKRLVRRAATVGIEAAIDREAAAQAAALRSSEFAASIGPWRRTRRAG